MDQARLTCHLSGAFTGLLDVGSPPGVLVDSSVGVFAII